MIGRDEFADLFGEVSEKIRQALVQFSMPRDIVEHVMECIFYNIPGGKMNRGLSVVEVVGALEPAADGQRVKKARVLGWMVEWLQGFFLVADDIMDGSCTRRGKRCWYLVEGKGKMALNDALLLQSCMHFLLREYFGSEHYYGQLVDAFMLATLRTELGQLLDLTSSPTDVDAAERYRLIGEYKTAHYSFVLPAVVGFMVCGREMPDGLSSGLVALGQFFQVQDDYLDVWGDPAVTGKEGTDIAEGKCTWPALRLNAKLGSDDDNRRLFVEHFGRPHAGSVGIIRQLYERCAVRDDYVEYHDEVAGQFGRLMDGSPECAPIIRLFADKIFNRQK